MFHRQAMVATQWVNRTGAQWLVCLGIQLIQIQIQKQIQIQIQI